MKYEGSKEFEAQLVVRVKSGNPPDIAYRAAARPAQDAGRGHRQGRRRPRSPSSPTSTSGSARTGRSTARSTASSTPAPLDANVKSFVWYSPTMFEENGWTVPTTWDEMIALSDTIAASGIKPWCAGIGSGEATGWPVTDWLEDVMLRDGRSGRLRPVGRPRDPVQRPAGRDGARPGRQHPQERQVRQRRHRRRQEHRHHDVPGRWPARSSTASAPCTARRASSANFGPTGTKIGEDGDVFAFYLPPTNEDTASPSSVAATSSPRSTTGPRCRRSRPTCPRTPGPTRRARPPRAAASSAPTRASTSTTWPARSTSCPCEILQDPDAVFRFDGSDLMPGAVGAGSFWKEMTAWITGQEHQGRPRQDRGAPGRRPRP